MGHSGRKLIERQEFVKCRIGHNPRNQRRVHRVSGPFGDYMLLQVHDELVLESPPEEIPEIKQLVKQEMERVIALEVPLIVDVGTGPNWRDAK